MSKITLIAGTILACGITLGGFFPGYYYYKTHFDMRTVTVKGLAEKDVKADLAVWQERGVIRLSLRKVIDCHDADWLKCILGRD